jgi:arginyl-tRNA synthetase
LIWARLTEQLSAALRTCGWHTPEREARIELVVPREVGHGDWTTNLALSLARQLKIPPRTVAEALARAFPADPAVLERVEVAGPGFLNFHYAPAFVRRLALLIHQAGPRFGSSAPGQPRRVLVEYVSANPTGPLNVVSARAAAVGSALVRLLRTAGHHAESECYVNDAGRQVELLGETVAARFAQSRGESVTLPEDAYQGSYLEQLARGLPVDEASERWSRRDHGWFRDRTVERIVEGQRRDLADYGVEFDRWFRESTLHREGEVERTLADLESRGVVYVAEGARWLRTTDFGDDKDRVLVRSNGVPTYLLPDIAYHRSKAARGFDRFIDLWGPDHHGHIVPMQASLDALGLPRGLLEVLIVQQVNLLASGQPVKMSKRAGDFVTLADLLREVGPDCAKFFFLLRSTNAHLDFDLDLAKRQNDENPAFYVQYAHARIAGIERHAAERGLEAEASEAACDRLVAAEETALLRLLATWPAVVRGAAAACEPHRVPAYLMEVAASFHRFYHACRVVSDDLALSRARLLLAGAARTVLRNGLGMLGISAPERMERAGAEVPA